MRQVIWHGWFHSAALILMIVATCPLSPVPCPTAGAEELKIGYVNMAKVFDGYAKTQTSDASLEKRGKQKEAELKGRMDELQKMRQNLELLSAEAREAKAREIEQRADELQRFRTHTAQDLRRERDAIAKGLLEEIQRGVQAFANANGFSLILDGQAIVYGQDAYDVTDEVLAALNGRKGSP